MAHIRKQIRLKGYDYAAEGFYFLTICTYEREHYFGSIVEKQMHLSNIGMIADQCWREIPNHYPHVRLDAFIVMPNHVHGIIVIDHDHSVGAPYMAPLRNGAADNAPKNTNPIHRLIPGSIGAIVQQYKSAVSRIVHQTDKNFAWQRSFYDRIIRNERALITIQRYIHQNPANWQRDRNNLDEDAQVI